MRAFASAAILLLWGCQGEPVDHARLFKKTNALAFQPETEIAVGRVNSILPSDSGIVLVPSWKPRTNDPKEIPVYLVNDAGLTPEARRAELVALGRVIDNFVAEMDRLPPLSPDLENLKDTDPNVADMYRGYGQGGEFSRIYAENSRVDTARIYPKCRCIFVSEADVQKLWTIFGRDFKGEYYLDVDFFLTFILLHEIGHISAESTNVRLGSIATSPIAHLYNSNDPRLDELRADAVAATLLRNACFQSDNAAAKDAAANVCLTLAVHSLQLFMYGLFDKSKAGLERRYLDLPPYTHPNYPLRLLAIGAIVSPADSQKADILLRDFLETRKSLEAQPN